MYAMYVCDVDVCAYVCMVCVCICDVCMYVMYVLCLYAFMFSVCVCVCMYIRYDFDVTQNWTTHLNHGLIVLAPSYMVHVIQN